MERPIYEWSPSSHTTPVNPTIVAPYESADQARVRDSRDQAVMPQQAQHHPNYIYDTRSGFFTLHDTMPFPGCGCGYDYTSDELKDLLSLRGSIMVYRATGQLYRLYRRGLHREEYPR